MMKTQLIKSSAAYVVSIALCSQSALGAEITLYYKDLGMPGYQGPVYSSTTWGGYFDKDNMLVSGVREVKDVSYTTLGKTYSFSSIVEMGEFKSPVGTFPGIDGYGLYLSKGRRAMHNLDGTTTIHEGTFDPPFNNNPKVYPPNYLISLNTGYITTASGEKIYVKNGRRADTGCDSSCMNSATGAALIFGGVVALLNSGNSTPSTSGYRASPSGQISVKVEGLEYDIKSYDVKNSYGSSIASNVDCLLCGSWMRAYGEYGEYTISLTVGYGTNTRRDISFKVDHKCNNTVVHISDLKGDRRFQHYCY